MKKLSIFIIAVLSLFTACDPVQDSHDAGGNITADELKAASKVTVYQENGKNINFVHFTTTAPVSVKWTNGNVTMVQSDGDMQMLVTGEQTLSVIGLNPDGSQVQADFNVNVEQISDNHPVSPYWQLLTGGSEKTWVWDDSVNGHCWGNCDYKDTGNQGLFTGGDWWGVDVAGVTGQVAGYNYDQADGGPEASMTFVLKGSKIIKSSGGTGTFAFDENTDNMGKRSDAGPVMGHFSTTGAGILFPVPIDCDGATTSQFDICYIDEHHLVLAFPCASAKSSTGSEGCYWRFKAK